MHPANFYSIIIDGVKKDGPLLLCALRTSIEKRRRYDERDYQKHRSCSAESRSSRIQEGNRERIQVFEGVVLKKQGGGCRETFTVRKNSNGIGVEKTWPLHSPNVEKVEVVRRGKVRRAKLNYLRNRVGKAAKVKELVK